jgi:hypothetical protein
MDGTDNDEASRKEGETYLSRRGSGTGKSFAQAADVRTCSTRAIVRS